MQPSLPATVRADKSSSELVNPSRDLFFYAGKMIWQIFLRQISVPMIENRPSNFDFRPTYPLQFQCCCVNQWK